MSVPELQPGTVFASDYRVIKFLDRGGMGDVYLVEQLSTGQRRALKLMQHDILEKDRSAREKFAQEARVASRIRSDHIVQVIAAGVIEDTPWLVMELLEGDSLAAVVHKRGLLAIQDVRTILAQIAHGLTAAHAAGVVHRDLKPENVFLTGSRSVHATINVKILDFGIAKVSGRLLTLQTIPLGTLGWAAPEQFEAGQPVGPYTDVWAFGLLTFWLLTGRPYWVTQEQSLLSLVPLLVQEMSRGAVVPARHRAMEYQCPRVLPEGFDAWFARCVAPDRTSRFQDIPSARTELEGLLEHVVDSPGPMSNSTGASSGTRPSPPSGAAPITSNPGGFTKVGLGSASMAHVNQSEIQSGFGPSAPPIVVPPAPPKRNTSRWPAGVATAGISVLLLATISGVAVSQSATWANRRCTAERRSATARNAEDVEKICSKACEGGLAAACTKDGELITQFGIGARPFEKAREAYDKACSGNDLLGCRRLAELTLLRDSERASQLLQRACTAGDAMGCAELGAVTEMIAPSKVSEAASRYANSCEAGAALGCAYRALLFNSGRDGTRDATRAQTILKDKSRQLELECEAGEGMSCVARAMAGELGGDDVKTSESFLGAACRAGADIGCFDSDTLRAVRGSHLDRSAAPTDSLRNSCTSGTAAACTNLAALKSGESLTLRYGPAGLVQLKLSCEGNLDVGCAGFGASFAHPSEVEVNRAEAIALSDKACEAGQLLACVNSGGLQCSAGDGSRYATAAHAFERACDGGDPGGCGELGTMYQRAQGVSADAARGKSLLKRACDAGELDACVVLLNDGTAAGAEALRKLCETDRISAACNAYGSQLAYGSGISKNLEAGRSLLERSARGEGLDRASTTAFFTLASFETNDERAASLFRTACDKKIWPGCAEYAVRRASGKGVAVDLKDAGNLLIRGCDEHDTSSCRYLYTLSWDGKGPMSKQTAAEGVDRLCGEGDGASCLWAGTYYRQGASPGLPRDASRAKQAFERACQLGLKQGCQQATAPVQRKRPAAGNGCEMAKELLRICYDNSAPQVSCSQIYYAAAESAEETGLDQDAVANACLRACQSRKSGISWTSLSKQLDCNAYSARNK